MTEKPIIADRFEPTLRQEAELDAFRRMLDASAGTCSLSLAICNSPALRDFLIQKIAAEKSNIVKIQLDESVTDVFDFVDQQVSSKQPQALFVFNMESALPSQKKEYKILQSLNFSRERWKARFSCPVVFWLPEYAAALLSIHARDLYSWISHQFEFVSEQASPQMGRQDQYAGDTLAASSLTIEQKQFRIAELEQRIADAGDPPKSELTDYYLVWLNELAFLYKFIGDLDRAEDMHQKALEIDLKLDNLEGQAIAYGNLGIIYKTRGELDCAEDMLQKALKIHLKLDSLEGQATDYTNLGLIYQIRGELERADDILQKALKIHLKLGSLDGQAADYGNLGITYQIRGDLECAEDMHKKALEIHLKIGRLEGQASDYSNLGLIYRTRGDLDRAEDMHQKALKIDLKLGNLEGQAADYGNLGNVYYTRGELDRAEDMLQKSLKINLKLGHLEGQANQYGNLGQIYRSRGDLKQARSFSLQAHRLFQQIGMPHRVKQINDWLNTLPPESPD